MTFGKGLSLAHPRNACAFGVAAEAAAAGAAVTAAAVVPETMLETTFMHLKHGKAVPAALPSSRMAESAITSVSALYRDAAAAAAARVASASAADAADALRFPNIPG